MQYLRQSSNEVHCLVVHFSRVLHTKILNTSTSTHYLDVLVIPHIVAHANWHDIGEIFNSQDLLFVGANSFGSSIFNGYLSLSNSVLLFFYNEAIDLIDLQK